MLNKVCIMGRLVRDPELRRTQAGIAVTTMRIAVDRDFKSQDGTKQADFFDVVAWRNTAEFVSRYFSKGRMMVVEGRLQTRDWTDREGNKRVNTEIVADNIYFGESRRDASNGEYGGASGGYGSGGYGGYGSGYNSGGASGYGSNNGFASSNPSGGYGSGYGSGGYSSGANNGFASSNPSGGHGSYGSGAYGGYGSGGFGAYDTPANSSADASSGASADASGAETPAPAKESAPASDSAPSSFAEVADDDGDLPF